MNLLTTLLLTDVSKEFNEDQPRDENGRGASGGGSGGATRESAVSALGAKGFKQSLIGDHVTWFDRQTSPKGDHETITIGSVREGPEYWRHTNTYGELKTSGQGFASLQQHVAGLVSRDSNGKII